MSEPGTPSETDIRSKSWRLQSLLGVGFILKVEWIGLPLNRYEIAAFKGDHHATWSMIPDDFKYRDDELITKFIAPIKDCFARLEKSDKSTEGESDA